MDDLEHGVGPIPLDLAADHAADSHRVLLGEAVAPRLEEDEVDEAGVVEPANDPRTAGLRRFAVRLYR